MLWPVRVVRGLAAAAQVLAGVFPASRGAFLPRRGRAPAGGGLGKARLGPGTRLRGSGAAARLRELSEIHLLPIISTPENNHVVIPLLSSKTSMRIIRFAKLTPGVKTAHPCLF